MSSIVLDLHGRLLRDLADELGVHFQGLHQAARRARGCGRISNQLAKKLGLLGKAFNVLRHTTAPLATELCEELQRQLASSSTAGSMSDSSGDLSTPWPCGTCGTLGGGMVGGSPVGDAAPALASPLVPMLLALCVPPSGKVPTGRQDVQLDEEDISEAEESFCPSRACWGDFGDYGRFAQEAAVAQRAADEERVLATLATKEERKRQEDEAAAEQAAERLAQDGRLAQEADEAQRVADEERLLATQAAEEERMRQEDEAAANQAAEDEELAAEDAESERRAQDGRLAHEAAEAQRVSEEERLLATQAAKEEHTRQEDEAAAKQAAEDEETAAEEARRADEQRHAANYARALAVRAAVRRRAHAEGCMAVLAMLAGMCEPTVGRATLTLL